MPSMPRIAQTLPGQKTMSQMQETDVTQFKRPLKRCVSMEDFRAQFALKDAGYSIRLNKTILDAELHVRDPRMLMVFFNAAVPRDNNKIPPRFSGRGISSSARASCLFLSDPVLYLDETLGLGWYAGSKDDALQTIIADLIQFVAGCMGAERVLFFGGSGGGFASMYYARRIPGALSLVWNPQTILKNYYPKLVDHYARVAFECNKNKLGQHIHASIPEYYEATPGDNKVIYMQSRTDNHVARHLLPYLAGRSLSYAEDFQSGWLNDDTYLHLTDWSDGHRPPPRKALEYLVSKLADPALPWDREGIAHDLQFAQSLKDAGS
jgi:pimeloyl-ACP methyl ester carboxylesterase